MVWDDLKYWSCGEWDVVQEKLDDLQKKKIRFNPTRECIFAAMDALEMEKVKVAIIGQDPYPNPKHATGIAFSIPPSEKEIPSALINIFKEYTEDLHYDYPVTGNLLRWVKEGVFLWNAYPTCEANKSLSHYWPEWSLLTIEIIEELSKRDVVFAFLGGVAREFVKHVNQGRCDVIETAHPSPRGNINAKTPFLGSRIFTEINRLLVENGNTAIDWRL